MGGIINFSYEALADFEKERGINFWANIPDNGLLAEGILMHLICKLLTIYMLDIT